jgi:hypothetical protein
MPWYWRRVAVEFHDINCLKILHFDVRGRLIYGKNQSSQRIVISAQ